MCERSLGPNVAGTALSQFILLPRPRAFSPAPDAHVLENSKSNWFWFCRKKCASTVPVLMLVSELYGVFYTCVLCNFNSLSLCTQCTVYFLKYKLLSNLKYCICTSTIHICTGINTILAHIFAGKIKISLIWNFWLPFITHQVITMRGKFTKHREQPTSL